MKSSAWCLVVCLGFAGASAPAVAEQELELKGTSIDLSELRATKRSELSVTDEAGASAVPGKAQPLNDQQKAMVDQLRANIDRRVDDLKRLAATDSRYTSELTRLQEARDSLSSAHILYSPHGTSDSSDYAFVSAESSTTLYLTPRFFQEPPMVGYVAGDPDLQKTVQANAEKSFQATIARESVLVHESVHLGQSGLNVALPWNWAFFYFQKERSAYETQYDYLRLHGEYTDGSRYNEQLNVTLSELEWYRDSFGAVGKSLDNFTLLAGVAGAPDRATLEKIVAIARDSCKLFDWKFGVAPLPPEMVRQMFQEHLEREQQRARAAVGQGQTETPASPGPSSGQPPATRPGPQSSTPPPGNEHWLIKKLRTEPIRR